MKSSETPNVRATLACIAGSALIGTAAGAGTINDSSFFDSVVGSTMIDFETDGSGGSVNLLNGQSSAFGANEYASLGVVFSGGNQWVNDGGVSFDAAQLLSGISGENSIPGATLDTFSIEFTTEIDAVGFWIANNYVTDSTGPTIVAYDDTNTILESVNFGTIDSSSIFVDGRIGVADYGFMGLTTDVPIARIEITKDAAILDDFIFGDVTQPPVIPLPHAAGMGLAGLAIVTMRRRRSMDA